MRASLYRFFKKAFSNKYLLYTNLFISTGSSCLGDAIEQQIEHFKGELHVFDRTRNFNMGVTGFGAGIITHNWYKFLDIRITGEGFRIAARKMILDQIFCSPLCIANMFILLAVMEGRPMSEALKEFEQKAVRLYTAEWVVWPPAQMLNFYVIPLRFRLTFDSLISLGYDIYYSFVRHDDANLKEQIA